MTSRLILKPAAPGSSVLWTVDPRGRRHATDADELGLSEELAEVIEEWLDDLDARFDEATSRYALDAQEEAEHRDIVTTLVEALREELGEDWLIEAVWPPEPEG